MCLCTFYTYTKGLKWKSGLYNFHSLHHAWISRFSWTTKVTEVAAPGSSRLVMLLPSKAKNNETWQVRCL